MAVVPVFDLSKIRAIMEKNQHLLDKADACFRKHDLVGALDYRVKFYKPLGSYPYVTGMKANAYFWSICGAVVTRYGNDPAYAMIWNADWCDEETSGGSPGSGLYRSPHSALCDFFSEINRQYVDDFKNSYGGGIYGYMIDDEQSRRGCFCEPSAWTVDMAGLWRGHQTGNELMRPIKLFKSDELTGWHSIHVFIKTGDVRGILTVNSSDETERTGRLWSFYSEDYGDIGSPTPLADVVKNGYFTVEMPLRGGRFTALCSNERIVATLKDYLEGGPTKQNEDRGRLRILDDVDASKIYDQFSIPRYTPVHESTIV